MANITVSELLLDPDFVDTVTIYRQVETTGIDGIATRKPVSISILASIQSNEDLQMMTPDLNRTSGTYEIITNSPLLTSTDVTNADMIMWNGRLFRLISVGRFDNFATGFGHYEGVMELVSVQPVPTDAT